ncbi:MAG TPA: bifunctional adenosylcobinamide kinase/adenosylcobinamide-phosphate guanylyltransferase [Spongiibacteraceae bacterium]|jgi:adenosylcobinamide kinase/adenosylcobinamide-phosphate guanylyltransferase
MLELVLGGARSGKSLYAEQRALSGEFECIYIATALDGDAEMVARIRHHRERRSGFSATIEEPIALAHIIAQQMSASRCLLIDCLTLWLTNLLLLDDESRLAQERSALFDVLARARGHILLVSNEVGQGIVPADALSRRFVDESGRLHQQLAALCDRVVFIVAGLPQILKGEPFKFKNTD